MTPAEEAAKLLTHVRRLYEAGRSAAAREYSRRASVLIQGLTIQEAIVLVKKHLNMKMVNECNLTNDVALMHVYVRIRASFHQDGPSPSEIVGVAAQTHAGSLPSSQAHTNVPSPSELLYICRNAHTGKVMKSVRFFVDKNGAFGLCERCAEIRRDPKKLKRHETKYSYLRGTREISEEKALKICYIEDVMSA